MPIPFHCHECDSPTMNTDGICDTCKKRKKEMVTSNKIGESLENILPSMEKKKVDV